MEVPLSEGVDGPSATISHDGIVRLHKEYPVASVLASCDFLSKLQTHVLGCPRNSGTTKLPPDGRRGALGRRTLASYGVLESQQRDALH